MSSAAIPQSLGSLKLPEPTPWNSSIGRGRSCPFPRCQSRTWPRPPIGCRHPHRCEERQTVRIYRYQAWRRSLSIVFSLLYQKLPTNARTLPISLRFPRIQPFFLLKCPRPSFAYARQSSSPPRFRTVTYGRWPHLKPPWSCHQIPSRRWPGHIARSQRSSHLARAACHWLVHRLR